MRLIFNRLYIEDGYSNSPTTPIFSGGGGIGKIPLECINCRFNGVKNPRYNGNENSHYLFASTQFNSAGWPADISTDFFLTGSPCIFECNDCLFNNITTKFINCDQIVIKNSIFNDINVIDNTESINKAIISFIRYPFYDMERTLVFENVEINNVKLYLSVYLIYKMFLSNILYF